jgi:hypothetical protein
LDIAPSATPASVSRTGVALPRPTPPIRKTATIAAAAPPKVNQTYYSKLVRTSQTTPTETAKLASPYR